MSFLNRIIPKLNRRKSQIGSKLSQNSDTSLPPNSTLIRDENNSNGAFELDVADSKKDAFPLRRHTSSGKDETLAQFLQNHVLFKGLDDSFLKIIAASMQARIFKDMDFVIKKGQVGRAMFFVQRGVVEVISEDGKQHVIYY
jgi:hypothetical protein